MSLIRQVWLLLFATLLLALAASVTINVLTTRDTLETQLRLKNSDNAAALALALSQQRGDRELMDLLLTAQFDTGFYRSVRFTGADGRAAFKREASGKPLQAPQWFVELASIDSQAGVAQVSDGWRPLGSVAVVSHASFAHDALWRASLESAALLGLVGLAAGALAMLGVRRIERPLESTVQQARSLVDGRFITVPEPRIPELQRVTSAMNSMVQRLKNLFEAQAAQLESLRQQAHCDALTGLANRGHFLGQLDAVLDADSGPGGGALVLLRLADPAELNRALGHQTVDRALTAIAQALHVYPSRVESCLLGRLNGSDFALWLPAARVAGETAHALAGALKVALPAYGPRVSVSIGVIEIASGMRAGQAMGAADQALAAAESCGPFAVEVRMAAAVVHAQSHGERSWREQIAAALDARRTQLVEFVVQDRVGQLIHLECPLRIQLEPAGPFEPAARWLPLAMRSRLTSTADLHAVTLALHAIAADGRPRCVNLAPASLHDGAFVSTLRELLAEAPAASAALSLEFAEAAAVERFRLLQSFGRAMRPLGVRFGLEHAGERLAQIEHLFEAGLDYVKLDAAVTRGVARDAGRAAFVKNSASLLHGLSLQVIAEGVANDADLQALWGCGVDGITGPWVSEKARPSP